MRVEITDIKSQNDTYSWKLVVDVTLGMMSIAVLQENDVVVVFDLSPLDRAALREALDACRHGMADL